MTSLDGWLRRLQRQADVVYRSRPPEPRMALLTERLYVAMTMSGMEYSNGFVDVDGLRACFFEHLSHLRVIVPESLKELLWQRALFLHWMQRRDEKALANLRVTPAMREITLELRDGRPSKPG